jgi:hypothetical protein
MFKVIKCPTEYIEIRKRLRVQESNLNIIQTPSIQDRTINDHFPMFVEVNNGRFYFRIQTEFQSRQFL